MQFNDLIKILCHKDYYRPYLVVCKSCHLFMNVSIRNLEVCSFRKYNVSENITAVAGTKGVLFPGVCARTLGKHFPDPICVHTKVGCK